MVRKLFEKGADHDAILIAIEAAEHAMLAGMSASRPQMSADESADRRREKDRIRKRLARGNPQISAECPQTSADASLSKKEILTESPSLERGAKQRVSGGQRGQRLPDGWRPTTPDWRTAADHLGDHRARVELEKFRDHWKQQPGQRGVKLDWNAAWRNWTRRAGDYGGHNGKTPNGGGSILAAFDEVIAGTSQPDRGAGEETVLMLPFGPSRRP